ncbi:hypothetical protein ES703_02548 [subsurface metagenome]
MFSWLIVAALVLASCGPVAPGEQKEGEKMNQWTVDKAKDWYLTQPWLVGCNFLPSTAVNQLEMWQADTYDAETIDRELSWAQDLGFNTLRVYLHDLVWSHDPDGFAERIDHFLGIADHHGMRVILVLFDDCHRPDPEIGVQPLPVSRVHNSGWKHSPGQKLVLQFHDGTVVASEKKRLKEYVQGVLTRFKDDERVLMWDLYNEPGQTGNGDKTNVLLKLTWEWAQDVRPSQPLTACLDGSVGEGNIAVNADRSDIITFHCYWGDDLEQTIIQCQETGMGRPIICTEYMARELGTTFQHSLPIFKKHRVGCYNWGLVAGKSQTHWNWASVLRLERRQLQGAVLKPGDPIPEPALWFHDIFRIDGTPFDQKEVDFIKDITGSE